MRTEFRWYFVRQGVPSCPLSRRGRFRPLRNNLVDECGAVSQRIDGVAFDLFQIELKAKSGALRD